MNNPLFRSFVALPHFHVTRAKIIKILKNWRYYQIHILSTSWLKLFYKALKSLSVDKIRACDYLTFLTRLQGCKYQTLKTWIVSNKWASKTLSVNIDRFTPLCWFWLLDWQFKYSSSHDFDYYNGSIRYIFCAQDCKWCKNCLMSPVGQ